MKIESMKKLLLPILIIVIIGIAGTLILKGQFKKRENLPFKTEMPTTGKRAIMIIAFKDFRDVEYFVPKEILEKAGVEVKTASNKTGVAIGADGGEANVDLLVSQINVADFDVIIFVGGPGCLNALDNETSYRVAKEAISQNKILAAICISPVILAKAGVLSEKKATVWSSPLDKSAVKILKEKGAIYIDEKVVQDGNIITANGPQAARDFGNKILDALNLKE